MAHATPGGAPSLQPTPASLSWATAGAISTRRSSFCARSSRACGLARASSARRIQERRRGEARAPARRRPRPRRDLTNRGEHSQRPTRQRAGCRQGGKAAGQAQRLLAASGPLAQPVRPRRPRLSAAAYGAERHDRCERWAAITGMKRAASASGRWKGPPERACGCLVTISSPTT